MASPRRKDRTGQRYGAWTVVAPTKKATVWTVRCTCGLEVERYIHSLIAGRSTCCNSCGRQVKHGYSYEPEYQAWVHMRSKRKGLDWEFSAFLAELGPRPEGSGVALEPIDRSLPLGPGNAKWGTLSGVQRARKPPESRRKPEHVALRGVQLVSLRVLEVATSGRRTPEVALETGGRTPNVYKALLRLEARALVQSRKVGRRVNGIGPSPIWTITAAGSRELAAVSRQKLQRAA